MSKITLHDRLSFNYLWATLSDNPQAFQSVVREFPDNGVRCFVINNSFIEQLIRSREKVDFFHRICKEINVEFCSVHGMDGDDFDLNIPVSELCPAMFQAHIRAMEIAAECKNYVLHIGATFYCNKAHPASHTVSTGIRNFGTPASYSGKTWNLRNEQKNRMPIIQNCVLQQTLTNQ